jgi:preprotein translocase subunit SecD
MRTLKARLRKAGTTGLFLLVLLIMPPLSPGAANAELLRIEVDKAEVEFDFNTRFPIIVIYLKAASRDQLAEFTTTHLERTVELRIDGRVVMKPVIREPIVNGVINMHGTTHLGESRTLAEQLSSGTSRIEIEVVRE